MNVATEDRGRSNITKEFNRGVKYIKETDVWDGRPSIPLCCAVLQEWKPSHMTGIVHKGMDKTLVVNIFEE